LRQRRLGEMQTGGRAAEVKLFSDGDEVTEMAQLDIAIHKKEGKKKPLSIFFIS